VLHYDFLFIKDSNAPETPYKNIVVRTDLSLFLELIPCREETAFVLGEPLLDWYKRFCTMSVTRALISRMKSFLN
jgi:hypothetical protein